MKKRLLAGLMLVVMLFASVGVAASATTKNGVGTKKGTWKYDCSVLKWSYYSDYNDDTSWTHNVHPISYVMSSMDHGSWVRNNKTWNDSGWVYARCGTYSHATVSANWSGGGSASWTLR